MPLVPQTLNTALDDAFNKAMLMYTTVIESAIKDPSKVNPEEISKTAREKAAKTFADIATPAIDSYIKTATIIVPPGQVIAGSGGGPAPVVGSTTSPSQPASIT